MGFRSLTTIAFLFSLSSVAPAAEMTAPNSEEIMRLVSAYTQRVMNSCSQNLWPGYTWDKLDLVLLDGQKNIFFYNGRTGEVSKKYDMTGLPKDSLDAPFAFIPIRDGRTLLSMNVDRRIAIYESLAKRSSAYANVLKSNPLFASIMFTTGIHEAFHAVGQELWAKPAAGSSREIIIPINAEPRLFRRAIFDGLYGAFKNPKERSRYLGQAKFWFEKWRARYPEEAINFTDYIEGSAEYVGVLARGYLDVNCNASTDEVRNTVAKRMEEQKWEINFDGSNLSLGDEGYKLGALAGFILQFDLKAHGWQEKVSKGVSPVEILLRDASSLPNEIPATVTLAFENSRAELQTEIDAVLAPAKVNMRNQDSVFVALPNEWFEKRAWAYGEFYSEPSTGLEYDVNATGNMPFVIGDSTFVEVQPESVFVRGLNSGPCAHSNEKENRNVLVLEAGHLSVSGGIATADSPQLKGTMRGELKTGEDGRHWFCPRRI